MNQPLDLAHQPMPTREKILYSVADAPTCLIYTFLTSWLLYFYTDIMRIPVLEAGTILLVARFIDVIANPVVGHFVDKTHTKWGKARPYLLWFSVPLAAAGILLFYSPDFSPVGKLIYAYITYIVFMFLYTLVGVPYNTLLGLVTQDEKERMQLSRNKQLFALIGIIGVSFVPLLLPILGSGTTKLEVERSGFTYLAIILGGFVITGYMLAFFNTKERVTSSASKEKSSLKKHTLASTFKSLGKNAQFLVLVGSLISIALGQLIMGGLIIYFVVSLGYPDSAFTLVMVTYVILTALGLIVGPKYFAKLDYRRGMIILGFITLLLSPVLFINPYSLAVVLIFAAVVGFLMGISGVAGYVMLGDVAEYGEWKNGIESTGLVYSAYTFTQQFAAGLAGFACSLVLSIAGYNVDAAAQTHETAMGLVVAMVVMPLIFVVLNMIFMAFYKLNKKKRVLIRTELEQRSMGI